MQVPQQQPQVPLQHRQEVPLQQRSEVPLQQRPEVLVPAGVPAGASAARSNWEDDFELFFIGELEFGLHFPDLSFKEGLFVDYSVHAGEKWLAMSGPEGYVGQTQTAYADPDGVYVFNHPINFHFVTVSIAGWPRLHLQVGRLDEAGRADTVSYGSISLPLRPGHSELSCKTWTPVSGSMINEARAVHGLGRTELLSRQEVLDGQNKEARVQLVTKNSGTVRISVDTIFRNAKLHGFAVSER
mmetsp:Transcript_73600/g.137544  ORF Transcript_73600/g.137544 Transcript_73600/m.137544 type:complete len:242 (-) Transcript_73600:21-746(-)